MINIFTIDGFFSLVMFPVNWVEVALIYLSRSAESSDVRALVRQ